MVFQKRRSATLEKGLSRLRGLGSVEPALRLGNELTLERYGNLLEAAEARLQAYNLALAEADRARIEFAEAEASVSVFSTRLLSGVTAVYGKDSKQYEMAGGKPPSTYKRGKKRSPAMGLPVASESGMQSSAEVSGSPSTNGAMNGGEIKV